MRAQESRSDSPAERQAPPGVRTAGQTAPGLPAAYAAGAALSPAAMLTLQRSVGNATASRLLGGGPPVQRALAGAMANLTRERLVSLLPSYRVTDPDQIEAVLRKYDSLVAHQHLELRSIPQLLEATNRKDYPRAGVEDQIKQDLTARAGSSPRTTSQLVTLHRGDTRDPETVKQAGGLFGWGVVSTEHARMMMADWAGKSPRERKEWARNWKAETASRSDDQPYVATGTTAQKGGYDYTIRIPMQWESDAGAAAAGGLSAPQLGADVWPLTEASIMAIKLDEEVVFVTGIPAKYIEGLAPEPSVRKPPPVGKKPDHLRSAAS